MITENGGELLRKFTECSYREKVTQVTSGVWHVLGLGHSNAAFVEGNSGVILIDALDTLERGKKLSALVRQLTGKKVSTIIYTHSHPDHRGGAGAFDEEKPERIAFAPKTPPLERTDQLQVIQNLRGSRQFGYALTDEENISQGIGIREGIAYGESRAFSAPTTLYQQDKVVREIDGVQLEMVRLPGETEDQIMIWLPQKAVLCCADNYYGCWPNLYAIRGSQYRDIAAWLRSLETLLSYPARWLLPGHTAFLSGREEIRSVLGNFKDAIDSILDQTLLGMNEGKTADELAHEIKLPEKYAVLPYLGEFYGCVDWTVRAIYSAYLGWFDGNPTNLHPLAPKDRADKTVRLMGGEEAVWHAAENALTDRDYQWCLELCDLLLQYPGVRPEICGLKADALEKLGGMETSANGRHYYLTCAKELRQQARTNFNSVEEIGRVHLREMTTDDINLFKKWLYTAHVAKWYQHPSSWIEEAEKLDGEFNWIHHFIVEAGGQPIGFCQYYACADSDEDWEGYTKSGGSYSIDYLIGETEQLRRGYGRQIVGDLTEKIRAHSDAVRVVVQPEPENKASCGLLMSCGFTFDADRRIYVKILRESVKVFL